MPTIKSAALIREQEEQASQQGDVTDRLIARFPYKDFGIAGDGDGALLVTLPGGVKISVQRKTVDYYSQVAGGDADGKDDYSSAMEKINAAAESSNTAERTARLKEIVRYFAPMEFKAEKYSFTAYVLGQAKLTVDGVRNVYFAYAGDDTSKLTPDEKAVYDGGIAYALAYYKFLIGMLTVIG